MISDLRRLTDHSEVTAVYSHTAANASRFAHQYGIPTATSNFSALVARQDVDIVYLATPFKTHHALALQALDAGKHILIEKPMAANADEAQEIFDEARCRGLFVMEGMWFKFNPAFKHLASLISSGTIGTPRSLRAGFGFPRKYDSSSRWDPQRSPGALLDQGIYPVTLAQAIFGSPTTIACSGTTLSDGIDLTTYAKLGFPRGEVAFITTSLVEFTEPSAAIMGTGGWAVLPGMFWAAQNVDIFAGTEKDIRSGPKRYSFPFTGNGYVPMLSAITHAISAGETRCAEHTDESTVDVIRTLDSLRDSLTTVDPDQISF